MTDEAPALSFVVPSYEMAPYLRLGLDSLRRARAAAATSFEVLVVDDGSSDDTPAVLREATARDPWIRSVHRPRDGRSCRSLARNVGARASRGKHIVFLDAGVLVLPGLPDALARAWAGAGGGSADDVLVVGALGLFAWQERADFAAIRARFEAMDGEALADAVAALAREPVWCDRRQALFSYAGGDLSRWLPAPWLLAWSCALGLPRHRFDAVGGFDEDFRTWGAEDCDFALRLYDAGARFRAVTELPVVHVPHPTETAAEKRSQGRANTRRMHAKRFGRESELFVVLQDPFAAILLALRLDGGAVERALPAWGPALAATAARLLGSGAPDAAVVAAPADDVVDRFPRVTWIVPSRPLADRLQAGGRVASVRLSLGCEMADGDGSRPVVVLTDVIRLLPPALQAGQLREALRIGRAAYLLCTAAPDDRPEDAGGRREPARWPLTPLERLREVAAGAGVILTPLSPAPPPDVRAFALSASARSADG